MKKYLIPLALCVLFSVGCNQDRLDIPQKGVISIDDFYQTDEDAQMALVAAYDAVTTQYMAFWWNDNVWYALWNYLGDDMYVAGGDKTDSVAANELNAYHYPTNSQFITTGYTSFYRAIYAANLVIDHFDDGDTPVKKKAAADAKVLRALSYLQLAIGWGTPPIVDHVLDPSEKPTNAESREAVLDFIINDCQEALPLLIERQGPNDKNGAYVVTKALAQTIMGKAYLWKGDYANAQAALGAVIDSGNYQLVPSDRIGESFHAVGDGNSEKVFELNIDYDGSIGGGYTQHSQANMSWMWNWRMDHMICPNGVGSPVWGNGWGGANPSLKFVEDLIANDGMDSARRKAWILSYDEVLYDLPYASDGDNPVPGKTDFKATDINRGVNSGAGLYAHVGWFMWKVNINASDITDGNWNERNTRIFRYPEVLLMYAECAAMTGKDTDKALKLLNDIQNRAQSAHVSTALTLDEVKNEKYFEMWLEGCRFQDLVRWGDTHELADNGKSYPSFKDLLFSAGADKTAVHTGYVDYSDADWCVKTFADMGFQEKHKLFPFPLNEMLVNENLVQNPGW